MCLCKLDFYWKKYQTNVILYRIILFIFGGRIYADVIEFDYEGEITTHVHIAGYHLDFTLPLGASVTGNFSYDTNAPIDGPNSNGFNQNDYNQTIANVVFIRSFPCGNAPLCEINSFFLPFQIATVNAYPITWSINAVIFFQPISEPIIALEEYKKQVENRICSINIIFVRIISQMLPQFTEMIRYFFRVYVISIVRNSFPSNPGEYTSKV